MVIHLSWMESSILFSRTCSFSNFGLLHVFFFHLWSTFKRKFCNQALMHQMHLPVICTVYLCPIYTFLIDKFCKQPISFYEHDNLLGLIWLSYHQVFSFIGFIYFGRTVLFTHFDVLCYTCNLCFVLTVI